MLNKVTILFAYRNRDATRVKLALQSLQNQTNTNFEVCFIDYGSDENFSKAIEPVVNAFGFANYIYLGHSGLLWNKSKALNYGIKTTKSDYIVTADVDVLFTPNFIENIQLLKQPNAFTLFKIGYLSQRVTQQQTQQLHLKNVSTTHIGNTFGIGLYPKAILEKVGGLDEFFHFYGSEDEDLNARVELTGAKLNRCDKVLLYHQWHPRYPQKKDYNLTVQPRLTNVLRVNQRHFLQNKNKSICCPNHKNWGNCYKKEDLVTLNNAKQVVKLKNIEAIIVHFLEEELHNHYNGVIKIIFEEDAYYNSIKHKVKRLLGKQTQPYLSMKKVNDLVLKTILFRYRNHNYKYSISEDLKTIQLVIDLELQQAQ